MMAVEEINAAGGVNVGGVMRPFKVYSIDDRSAAPGTPVSDAIMAYEKLILEKKPNVLIVGTYRSEVALATMDLLSKYKTIELNCIQMTPEVQERIAENYEKYKYNFRVTHDSIQMAASIAAQADILKEKYGLSKAFIINEDAGWAHATANALKGMIEEKGWDILGHEVTPLGVSDYSPPLLRVQESGAQVIYTVFSLPETAICSKQCYDMRIPALLAGYPSYIVPGHIWETLEGKVEYQMVTAGELGLVPSEKYPKSVEFFEKFKERLGKWPDADHSGASSYDAVYIYKEAVERAGSLDPEKVIPALEATDYMGVNGRVRFDPQHQAIFGDNPYETACEVTFQWIDGERVPVLPKAIAEAEIQLPPWVELAE
jgi:branched-chain amino acid transport system substrate-binding protein